MIRDDTRAIFACQLMSEKRLNSVAVVNQEGEIVESFSGVCVCVGVRGCGRVWMCVDVCECVSVRGCVNVRMSVYDL